jgi:hypothetical protein
LPAQISNPVDRLLKIIHHDLLYEPLHEVLTELQMLRMRLIFVFRVLVRENNVQRDLITLLHDGAIALHHFAGAKFNNARNVFEKLICRREQFIGRDKIVRVGPEDDDVGKHDLYLSCKNSAHAPSGGKRKQRVMRGALFRQQ